MPNDLQKFLHITRGDDVFYMNLLQDRGSCPISDLCVSAADVASADAERAVTRIMGRPLNKVIQWMEAGYG
jgi:hypothetical protein